MRLSRAHSVCMVLATDRKLLVVAITTTPNKKKNKQIFTLHLCTVMNARIFHTNDYEFTQMQESLHMSESSVVSLAAFLRAKTDKFTKK